MGYPNLVPSGEMKYFCNGSLWIKNICGLFSTDHGRNLSSHLKMYLNPSRG